MITRALTLTALVGALTAAACSHLSSHVPAAAQDGDAGIPGYALGHPDLERSPVSLEEFELLKQTALFTDEDLRYLRLSRDLLQPQVDAILDVWYGFVASTPQLVQYFSDARTGEPDGDYLAAVRERFSRWVLDTAAADFDQDWLDHAHEIGLRHHITKKNTTDGVTAVPIIHFRYLVALHHPITATLRPFLESGDHTPQEVEGMHQAWIKAVLLQVILWSHPYVNDGEF